MTDIIIIGNGILALSLAFQLSCEDNSAQITIVGPTHRAGGATAAAGAMLGCFAEVTENTFTNTASQAKFEMSYKALKMWPNFVEKLNSKSHKKVDLINKNGTFVVLNSKSGELDTDNFFHIQKALSNYNEPFSTVHPNEIPGIEPDEDHRPLNAIYIPGENSIDSTLLINRLIEVLSNNKNVTFIDDKVTDLNYLNMQIKSVTLASNNILHANKIVLANGVYAQNLIDQLPEISNKIPRILSGTGYSVVLETKVANSMTHVIRTPNRAGACGLHAISRNNNQVYIGASNNINFLPQNYPSTGMVNFVINCGITQINRELYNSKFVLSQVGNRPASLDNFPLIGETSINGLYVLNGTYRDGLHQSPYLSQLLAKQILSNSKNNNYIFQPERSLIRTLTISQSIAQIKKHYLAGSYEHSMVLPKFIPQTAIADIGANISVKIHKKLGLTNYGLTPDIILMFAFDEEAKKQIPKFKHYFQNLV